MPCKCDNACGSCVCSKSNTLCTKECHGKKDITCTACLNTEEGKKVKAMSIKDIRDGLCAHNLSVIGDKSELMKRLADFLMTLKIRALTIKSYLMPSSKPKATMLLFFLYRAK